MKKICLVCNYQDLHEAPYDHRGVPSDEICPCCGFQYGFDDDGFCNHEESYRLWRKVWINNGCNWFSEGRIPPEKWNAKSQLKNIGNN
ncbi:hypothetical protein KQI74_06535 [Paenibacillus barcinonensis]|uniref:hypothetical protein n=1 Tax=Paenibacillus barcinonensis TaxID=198119 RepID=UPI001C0F8046|nr:hypothetical protein [Paenibacillus barcinonensis]MBU5351929.1 hypothetical protein [Paenibacillus barcinonensis]